jgi:hypothetical protein
MGFGPTNNRRHSERHEQEIIALYKGGRSLAEVREETGVPDGTVWDILKRNGVKCRSRKEIKPWQDPIDTLLLIRTSWLHEQGLTYKQIAKIMRVGESGVKYRLRAAKDRLGYKVVNRGHNNRPKAVVPGHVQRAVAAWGIGGED